jgi:hypothetical protein
LTCLLDVLYYSRVVSTNQVGLATMSTYTTYEDNNRVDSATDLSLNHPFTPDPDLESSQTISASSVMPYSAPWSQYNPWVRF